jgi:hypothetical protein
MRQVHAAGDVHCRLTRRVCSKHSVFDPSSQERQASNAEPVRENHQALVMAAERAGFAYQAQ